MGIPLQCQPQHLAVADHDGQVGGACDRGVDQGPVQQPGLLYRDDDLPEARALCLVDRDRVGQREVIEPVAAQIDLGAVEVP